MRWNENWSFAKLETKLQIKIEGSFQNYELDNSDKYLLHVLAMNVVLKSINSMLEGRLEEPFTRSQA
jgi:hypothetical protein